MRREEHANLARALLEASDRNFASGDRVQGSEELWGAATHAVMAVVTQLKWEWELEEILKEAVIKLVGQTGEPFLEVGVDAAVKFHQNFYDDEMKDYEIKVECPKVHRFVNMVLPMMKATGSKA